MKKQISRIFVVAAVVGGLVALSPRAAQAVVFTDNVLFSTADQGMWAPDKTQSLGGTNTYTAFNKSFSNQTIGDIVSTQVPGTGGTITNPLWTAWKLALDGCTALGFSQSTCINGAIGLPGIGSEPTKTVANPIPAAFIKNGAELTLSNMHLDFGIKTTLEVAPGKIGSDVNATAMITAPDAPIAAGQVVTLGTAGGVDGASLVSDFDLLNVGLTPFINMTGKAELEAWAANINVIPKSTLLNLNVHAEQGFVGAKIGDGGIELRAFGNSTFIPMPSGAGLNIPVPGVVPPPLDKFVGFPMGDVQVFIPQLDTPPDSSFDPATKTVTNQQDTTTRLGSTPLINFGDINLGANGPTKIDFAKVDVDLDVFSLLSGVPLGISGGIPLTATVELNALDLDFGTFFGIGQELSLTPKDILVDLFFSIPVDVETSPGVFETRNDWTVRLGDFFNIRGPGVDFDVTANYRLDDNVFQNLTQLFLTPGFSINAFQIKFGGALFSSLLSQTDFKIFSQDIPILGDPTPVHTYTDTSFALGGWNTPTGSTFTLLASNGPIASVAEPGTLALFGLGLVGIALMRRPRKSS